VQHCLAHGDEDDVQHIEPAAGPSLDSTAAEFDTIAIMVSIM